MKEAKYHSVFKVSNFFIEQSLMVDQTPSSTPEFSPVESSSIQLRIRLKTKLERIIK